MFHNHDYLDCFVELAVYICKYRKKNDKFQTISTDFSLSGLEFVKNAAPSNNICEKSCTFALWLSTMTYDRRNRN